MNHGVPKVDKHKAEREKCVVHNLKHNESQQDSEESGKHDHPRFPSRRKRVESLQNHLRHHHGTNRGEPAHPHYSSTLPSPWQLVATFSIRSMQIAAPRLAVMRKHSGKGTIISDSGTFIINRIGSSGPFKIIEHARFGGARG